ncbi:acyltransferase family protein [Rhizobium sp. NPDC090275]|uniref:acyltransferase family protein n=1 Tax=Rhizobium sp. NPDC090275 TaxID=3364498 RepID=UPI00383A7B21
MDGKLDFINTLRGVAILLVLTVHAGQHVEGFDTLTYWGARGVQLFFTVSAYTLAASWDRRNDGALPFYARRFFRIAPVFWLGICFYLFLYGYGPRPTAPSGIEFWHVAATATFMHGFFPTTINLIVPGGWSIAVEMAFYAIFPLVILALRNVRSSLIGLAIAYIVSDAWLRYSQLAVSTAFPGSDPATMADFCFLSLPSQVTAFAAGVAAYRIRAAAKSDLKGPWLAMANTGLALGIMGTVSVMIFRLHDLPLYGLTFGAIVLAMSFGAGRPLSNKALSAFGVVSFSMYISHFFLLDQITSFGQALGLQGTYQFAFVWIGTAAACLIVCSAIYRLIEVPSMTLGRVVAKAISQTNAKESLAVS